MSDDETKPATVERMTVRFKTKRRPPEEIVRDVPDAIEAAGDGVREVLRHVRGKLPSAVVYRLDEIASELEDLTAQAEGLIEAFDDGEYDEDDGEETEATDEGGTP